jgi:hypothetical protein
MSRWVEYSEHGARPLVKAYTRAEAQEMFKDFNGVKIQTEQLIRAELPVVGRYIPEGLFRTLRRSLGWNLIITATK